MSDEHAAQGGDLQKQLDDLRQRITENRTDIGALQDRAIASEARADDSDARQDKAALRADDSDARQDNAALRADRSEARSRDDRLRIYDLEERADVDRALIAELAADGMVSQAHVQDLETALRTSRTIGAALGIIMNARKVDEVDAFKALSRASQNTNRKLRVIADEIVTTGDLGQLPDHQA